MPGMGLEIDGAMQHAAQCGRQFIRISLDGIVGRYSLGWLIVSRRGEWLQSSRGSLELTFRRCLVDRISVAPAYRDNKDDKARILYFIDKAISNGA